MTSTPEQIEAVARAMKEAVGAEGLDAVEEKAYRLMAVCAIAAARPFIREQALEEAAKEVEKNAAVLDHPSVYMGGASNMAKRKVGFFAAAIRDLKDV
jgi:hypothetical protein